MRLGSATATIRMSTRCRACCLARSGAGDHQRGAKGPPPVCQFRRPLLLFRIEASDRLRPLAPLVLLDATVAFRRFPVVFQRLRNRSAKPSSPRRPLADDTDNQEQSVIPDSCRDCHARICIIAISGPARDIDGRLSCAAANPSRVNPQDKIVTKLPLRARRQPGFRSCRIRLLHRRAGSAVCCLANA